MKEAAALGIDPGLLERFRRAGEKVAWTDAAASAKAPARRPSRSPGGPRVRTARLSDERARVESEGSGRRFRLVAESGPVGALVVVIECTTRGVPDRLTPVLAGERPDFPMGAIEAEWGGEASGGRALSLSDLVGLARYALP
ncbi:MAG: hypothetical protein L3K23_07860 [Thermoplasmata archaeon]|nr:hypothetical protein [Thermoplasmata archaeon]